MLVQGLATFPSRRRTTSTANRDSPSEAGSTALQARRQTRPRKPSSDRNAACGRRLDPTTVCGDGRWTTALDCVGQVALSEGPSLLPPAAAERQGQRFPSSRRATRAPLWVVGSSYCGLDVPAVLMNRPRPSFLRHPAKGNALPKAGMPSTLRNLDGGEDRSSLHVDRYPPLRRGPLAWDRIATGDTSAFVFIPECLTLDEASTQR
jgi:hypothetical protein